MAHPWAKAGAAQRVRAKTNMDVRSFITLPALHRSYARQRGAAVGDSKKRVELVALKAAVEQVRGDYAFSQRRACGLMTMAVSSYRYQSRRSDEPLRTRLVELAREKPRFGYRRLHVLLGRSGEHVNHKRVHRVYRAAGLMIRRKKRKHCVEQRPMSNHSSCWKLDPVRANRTRRLSRARGTLTLSTSFMLAISKS